MKITELQEQSEIISNSTARDIGIQLYREARKRGYGDGHLNTTKKLADALANRFYSEILAAIDDEIRFQSAKSV